jgi:predicted ester cyclase
MKDYWAGLLFLGGYIATPTALAAVMGESIAQHAPHSVGVPKQIVEGFLRDVRAGKSPDNATQYMASSVIAHQLNAENETVVNRTPQNYADHIREFQRIFGQFDFEITELIADDDRVYARWKQTGCQIGPLDDQAPSGLPVVEIASAVYRVADGKIVEYWIQVDRKGIDTQIEANAKNVEHKVRCIR